MTERPRLQLPPIGYAYHELVCRAAVACVRYVDTVCVCAGLLTCAASWHRVVGATAKTATRHMQQPGCIPRASEL